MIRSERDTSHDARLGLFFFPLCIRAINLVEEHLSAVKKKKRERVIYRKKKTMNERMWARLMHALPFFH